MSTFWNAVYLFLTILVIFGYVFVALLTGARLYRTHALSLRRFYP